MPVYKVALLSEEHEIDATIDCDESIYFRCSRRSRYRFTLFM